MEASSSCVSGDADSQEGGAGTQGKSKRCDPIHTTPLWRPPLSAPESTGCHVTRGICWCAFPLPGHTNLIKQHIMTPPCVVVCSCPLPFTSVYLNTKFVAQDELSVQYGSSWGVPHVRNSPVVLVLKANRSVCFCVDFKKSMLYLNLMHTQCHSLMNCSVGLVWLTFYSTLNLIKGYWQFH